MKRMISLLLLLCLCAGLILPAAAADASVPADYWTDSGNYTEPSIDPATRTVTITSAAELAWLAWKCMQGTTFGEYTILLENDLDLSAHLWMPIGGRGKDGNGSGANAFAGVFDGQGHKIYGMQCVNPDNSGYTALFGKVSNGEIRNLSVEGSVSAYADAAMLIDSLAGGAVLNCSVEGTINTSRSYSASDVGALIGDANLGGTIYHCFANCVTSIDGSQYRGKFLGHGSAAVVNCCWNAETMEQSLDSRFENCYAIPANNTVDYASKLNAVMIEGAAKWVMDETGYPALDFQNRVQNWGEAAEAVTPVDGVYYIDRPGQLAYIAKIVNEGNTLKDQTVLLRSDLDLSGKSWVPIGFWTDHNDQTNFFGEFNGNHKTITGLTIPRNAAAYQNGHAGLFGYTTLGSSVHDLTLQGSVQSVRSNCGLLAGGAFGEVTRCTVSGEVSGMNDVGGIAGSGCRISQCNAQNVTLTATNGSAGGILGEAAEIWRWGEGDDIAPSISQCSTSGTITATNRVGGTVGVASGYASELSDCYSSADLTQTTSTYTYHDDGIGGIAGSFPSSGTMKNCYFTGSVTAQASDYAGLIVGYGGVSSDEPPAVYWSMNCKMTIDGMPANRRGVGTSVSEDPTSGLTLAQMQTKSSYTGWDFDTVWGMDANKNSGLPYLRWQNNVPAAIEPTNLSLTPEQATLAAGRSTTLTAVFYPIGAGGKLDWSSNAPDVASVTSDGQVTARGEGTAIIMAKCGSLSASCSVTVIGRSSDEYTIHEIMLKDANGSAVTGIPSGSFWAYVSVTKGENAKEATVLLVSYDQNDQYLGLTALEADVPCGTTYKLGAWFANTGRRIAKVKALVVDGVGTMRPLAAASEIG